MAMAVVMPAATIIPNHNKTLFQPTVQVGTATKASLGFGLGLGAVGLGLKAI